MSVPTGKLIAAVPRIAILLALASPSVAVADGITLTRSCQDGGDPACAVQVAPVTPVVAVEGPSTWLGPAIELNLGVTQLADAGAAPRASGSGASSAGREPTQPSGVSINSFEASVEQMGTATATGGNASSRSGGAQASGSNATQNPPSSGSGSDPGAGGGGQTPPGGGGGSASGINMITNVANIVQIVQLVARNNSNTTIAPIQVAQLCQQAAVSCSGTPSSGH
jgi:hypothetical protein